MHNAIKVGQCVLLFLIGAAIAILWVYCRRFLPHELYGGRPVNPGAERFGGMITLVILFVAPALPIYRLFPARAVAASATVGWIPLALSLMLRYPATTTANDAYSLNFVAVEGVLCWLAIILCTWTVRTILKPNAWHSPNSAKAVEDETTEQSTGACMSPKNGAVLYVKNIAKASMFYSRVAGLRLISSENDHVVLESTSFQLVLVAVPEKMAADIDISSPPIRRENAAIKLVFYISSISDARAVAMDLGGGLNAKEKEWTFQGHRVCDAFDPEGNIVQFRQF